MSGFGNDERRTTERAAMPLSMVLCPSVDAVVHDLFPLVRDWVNDGAGEIVLPRDWDLLEFFMVGYQSWLWDGYASLTAGERMAVWYRIERLLADEAKERRRVRFLRVWGFLRIWLGALAVLGAVAAWFNGWAWVWFALTGNAL